MLSFNSQNYVVEYKKATPQQWRGEAAKDNRLERVFGIFREPDEVNAIGSAMDCGVLKKTESTDIMTLWATYQ